MTGSVTEADAAPPREEYFERVPDMRGKQEEERAAFFMRHDAGGSQLPPENGQGLPWVLRHRYVLPL